ncbi:ATP-binding cassette, subfamily C, CydD [Georgenia satyanarayanai]|uniref:ATP-binding cassette, subfamily C, CydD n=1 Tax=Georgenia satyanarayanai TaxID=860221 RepID=A0A2Y9A1J8_9MICO|nr:thiol reductant ABC exporter subunit CydD [Georgenia satyanarayanai]PYG01559.1 ATP-binding cassette subfamily C protein CydD [Georgenia satyanarayanai]SSA36359.1 ATP-binding cassette, subfamily C, CydD [Georgenia satyanarayanai]
MKPLDPRLLRHARAARRYIALTTVLGLASAGLVVAQALLVAHAVAPVVDGDAGWAQVAPLVGWFAVVALARVLVTVVQESLAHRAAADVVAELRATVLARSVALGPRGPREPSEVVTLVTRGLDDLEPYFVRYLPQLLLAATLTPATLVVVAGLDLGSAAIIAGTIPLIPVFMWLIGVLTQRFAADRLVAMQRLGAQLLDLLAGLSTLKALGREHGPGTRVRALGRAYTRTTMSTLKVAFLSGAVLEFLASIAVALVAVTVGMRLVYGDLDLTTALAVLMLAPEAYRPVREVGAQFHASADGLAAAEQAFAVLEQPLPPAGTRPAPAFGGLVLDDVGVLAPGRDVVAPAGLSAHVAPGRVTALVGPSGGGKTTTAMLVLGLLRPDSGRVLVVPGGGREPVDLAGLDPESWHAQVTWVPQRPVLVPGTVADAVVGESGEVDGRAEAAARASGLDEVLAALPQGWATPLGQGGTGLSLGQRQRVALTRALLDPAPLVVLDEPSAHLDAASEQRVLDVVAALREQGRAVLVIAHRPRLVAIADDVVEVHSSVREPAVAAAGGAA